MRIMNPFFGALAAGGLAAVAAASVAAAQPGPGGWRHAGVLLEGASLTDDQKTRLHALMQADRAGNQGLREQIRAVREQIDAALLSSGSVTEAALAPLLQQQESLTQQLDARRLSEQVAIRNLLTPDQLAAAAATHAKLAALHDQEHALREQAAGTPYGQPD